MSALDEALARLCPATREAVEELEEDDDGADGCPLCGKPGWAHQREASCDHGATDRVGWRAGVPVYACRECKAVVVYEGHA